MCLLSEWFPRTWAASSPDPVTAWMAVAGSGVLPRKATLEASILPASRRQRRLPPSRTRPSTPAVGEHHRARPSLRKPRAHLLPTPAAVSSTASSRLPAASPAHLCTDTRRFARDPAAATCARRSSRWHRPWRSRRSRSCGIAVTRDERPAIPFTRQKSGRRRVRDRSACSLPVSIASSRDYVRSPKRSSALLPLRRR